METTNPSNPVSSLIRVSVLWLFLGTKNTLDFRCAAERIVDRIKNMEPVQSVKMIQLGMGLSKIIDRKRNVKISKQFGNRKITINHNYFKLMDILTLFLT